MSLWSDVWHTLSNLSDHFTLKETRDRKLEDLIRRRDALLDKQPTWTKNDSVELDRIVSDIERLRRLRPS